MYDTKHSRNFIMQADTIYPIARKTGQNGSVKHCLIPRYSKHQKTRIYMYTVNAYILASRWKQTIS